MVRSLYLSSVVVHTLVSALGRPRQVELYEYEVSLVYTVNSRLARVTYSVSSKLTS